MRPNNVREPEYNASKFRELLIYIANKSAEDVTFGATKLNKILYFCDFLAYTQLGAPITGAEYQKLDNGPAPRQLLREVEMLTQTGEAVVVPATHYGFRQKRLIALRDPNLSLFSPNEIALIDWIIEQFKDHNAKEISELSHEQSFGWQAVDYGETIPYYTAVISTNPPPPSAMKRARELCEHPR